VWVALAAARKAAAGQTRSAITSVLIMEALVGLSLGLVAVELFPDLNAQQWALRGGGRGAGHVSHYQIHALNLLQLLDPRALGGPADYFGPDNYWETLLSIGLVPLVLAAVGMAFHPNRRLVLGWGVLVAVAVVFAAGRRLGLFSMLYEL